MIHINQSSDKKYYITVTSENRAGIIQVYDFRNPPNGSNGFAWSDIDENWLNWSTEDYINALNTPVAEDGFNSDFDGMKWADACVMVLPCGRSANTEAGWMKGAGKLVYILSPIKQEPELMYKIHDGIFTHTQDLIDQLSLVAV